MHGPTHWEKEIKKDDSLEDADKGTKFFAIVIVVVLIGALLFFFSLSLSDPSTEAPNTPNDLQIGQSVTPTIAVNISGEEQGNFDLSHQTGIPTLVASPTPKPTSTRVPTVTFSPTPTPTSSPSPTQSVISTQTPTPDITPSTS